jgi:hypothetical protein
MPTPNYHVIKNGNEECFARMRGSVKQKWQHAATRMQDLSESVVLVSVRGWTIKAQEG